MKRLTTTVILVLASISLACSLSQQARPTAAPGPVDSQTSTAPSNDGSTPASNSIGMETYRDSVFNYAIDYPTGWTVRGKEGSSIDLTSYDPDTAPGRGGIPENEAKVTVAVLSEAGSTFDQLVAQKEAEWNATNPDGQVSLKITSRETWTLPGNSVPALRVEGEGLGPVHLLVTVIDGMEFQLTGFGDSAHFDKVALTLRR